MSIVRRVSSDDAVWIAREAMDLYVEFVEEGSTPQEAKTMVVDEVKEAFSDEHETAGR